MVSRLEGRGGGMWSGAEGEVEVGSAGVEEAVGPGVVLPGLVQPAWA